MGDMMVRKQIYLPKKQNQLLKRLAKQRGVSQAEVIRQALERETDTVYPAAHDSDKAWEAIKSFVEARKIALAGQGKPYRWNRQELYEERESRWVKPETEH